VTPAARAVMAARSPIACRFMAQVLRRHAARGFHAVRLARGTVPSAAPGRPVLVYANHPSWWDPVLFALLHRRVFPERAGFGPIAAAELRRYGVLRRIGVFGIEPGRRGAEQFLAVADGILGAPGTVLWVTAEGAFRDPRARPLRLRPGVAHLMRRIPGLVALPLALEYPFWQERAPEALARFGAPLFAEAGRGTAAWLVALTEALTETMDALAADAAAQDPERFECILAGRAGIGGVYDVWRRARAAWRGERLRLSHGAGP
jgi:1-acyl-sn-glycerol-3-phosphate acyltransferase